jgi:hypothetical protein
VSPEDERHSDELTEMLDKSAKQLGEHFDSVIIIATNSYNGDDFVRYKAASGSVFANYGATREWLLAYEERIKVKEHKPDDE